MCKMGVPVEECLTVYWGPTMITFSHLPSYCYRIEVCVRWRWRWRWRRSAYAWRGGRAGGGAAGRGAASARALPPLHGEPRQYWRIRGLATTGTQSSGPCQWDVTAVAWVLAVRMQKETPPGPSADQQFVGPFRLDKTLGKGQTGRPHI